MTTIPSSTSGGAAVTESGDVIDHLGRIEPGSRVAALRADRPALTAASQETYASLLEPEDDEGLTRRERELVALRVAVLTPDYRLAAWHQERAIAQGATDATTAAVVNFPAPSTDLTGREVAALRHTDLLVTQPTRAEQRDILRLREAGLSTREIITLAQLISFLTYQVRVLAVLRMFGDDE